MTTLPRIDGGAAWAGLTPEQQAEIGAIAIELAAAWAAQDALDDIVGGSVWTEARRAADAADILLIAALGQAVQDAIPPELLRPVNSHPPLPSRLGPVCLACGCTEHDACITTAGPCGWATPDLCSACAAPAQPESAAHA